MNNIIAEIEKVSQKMTKLLEGEFELPTSCDVNILYLRWWEYRRGLLAALRMLRLTVGTTDGQGLRWAAAGTTEGGNE